MLPVNAFSVILAVFLCINGFTSYPVQILCAFEIIEQFKFFNNKIDS